MPGRSRRPDLLAAVKAAKPAGDVARAAALLRRWNNTAAPGSRGAMLFEIWFQRYAQGRQGPGVFAHEWSVDDPLRTPRGLADPARAAEAFAWAVDETALRHGRWDVAWGDVHRVRRGTIDVPVGGCSGVMGCFRVLGFARDADGKLAAQGGEGWGLAVAFGETPRVLRARVWREPPAGLALVFRSGRDVCARGDEEGRVHRARRGRGGGVALSAGRAAVIILAA